MKFPTLLKNNSVSLLLLLVAIIYIFILSTENNSYKNDIVFWQNEAAKNKELYVVSNTLYERQTIAIDQLVVENEGLKGRLKDTDRKARFYANLSLQYRTKIDSISTFNKKDTVYTGDSAYVIIDSTARAFDYVVESELRLSGWFKITKPYSLYITDLKVLSNIDILLSEANDGSWFTNVETNSTRLTLNNLNVRVVPAPAPWEFFIGAGILGYDWTPKGFEVKGGIKKGIHGGYLHASSWENMGAFFGIGYIRFFNF